MKYNKQIEYTNLNIHFAINYLIMMHAWVGKCVYNEQTLNTVPIVENTITNFV